MVKMKWRNYLFWRYGDGNGFKFVLGVSVLWAVLNVTSGQTYCEDKPKILYYRRGQASLVTGANDEIANHVVISNVNKEFLACVSSRNVEWAYEGEGEPSKFQESATVDIQNDGSTSYLYCLTSQVTFYNKQSDTELSRHTGKYICREIGNVSNAASVYLYASRKNSPTFLHSRKTLTLPLSAGNITSIPVTSQSPTNASNSAGASQNATGSSGSNNNSGQTKSVFTIPCVTTRPDVTAKLLRKDRSNNFVPYTGVGYEFDPKTGFRLDASSANLSDLSTFFGEYKCVSSPVPVATNAARSIEEGVETSNVDVEDFVLITIVKAKSFKAYPAVGEIYVSGMLNLTCESEEPVIMKEVLPSSAQDVYSYLDDDYSSDRSDGIVETTERTDQKSHIANYMELSPAPGTSGEIQCISEKDGKVLHTWRYRIVRKRADKLSGIKFNKKEKSFTCKSKLGSPGRLSFVSCRTPSECRINRNCLMKSENCRGYSNSTRAFCERKSHFCGKIFYKGGSGLIRCIGEGIDEIRGFTDESADQAVRMGFGTLKASETAFLKLTGVNQLESEGQRIPNGAEGTVYEGDRVNVTLRMGYYFFLYPVQWAAKFRNGSTVQIDPDFQTLLVEKLARTVRASLTLPYTSATNFISSVSVNDSSAGSTNSSKTVPMPSADGELSTERSEIVALNALIPLRSSVDPSWKTITLPLTVYGRQNVHKPVSADLESEEVLLNSGQAASLSEGSSTNETVAVPANDDNDDEDSEDDEEDEVNGQDESKVSTDNAAQAEKTQAAAQSLNVTSTESSLPLNDSSAKFFSDAGTVNVSPNESILTENITSPSPASSSVARVDETISLSPSSTPLPSSDFHNDGNTSQNDEIPKLEDEIFLARSGLLDEDIDADTVVNQADSEYSSKTENDSAPAATTILPNIAAKISEEIASGSNQAASNDEAVTTTTFEQRRLSRLRDEVETTTNYAEVDVSS